MGGRTVRFFFLLANAVFQPLEGHYQQLRNGGRQFFFFFFFFFFLFLFFVFFFSGVSVMECCRVDDTSPENTIVGLPPN